MVLPYEYSLISPGVEKGAIGRSLGCVLNYDTGNKYKLVGYLVITPET